MKGNPGVGEEKVLGENKRETCEIIAKEIMNSKNAIISKDNNVEVSTVTKWFCLKDTKH